MDVHAYDSGAEVVSREPEQPPASLNRAQVAHVRELLDLVNLDVCLLGDGDLQMMLMNNGCEKKQH